MKQAVGFLISAVTIIILVFLTIQVITVEQQNTEAKEYYAEVVDHVENSDGYESVMQDIKDSNNGKYTVEMKEMVHDGRKQIQVKLTYKVYGFLIGELKQGTLEGYANADPSI